MVDKNKLINSLLFLFYLGFLVSIVFAFRAESSIAIGLILLAGFVKNKLSTGSFFNGSIVNNYLLACTLFFILQVTALIYTHHTAAGWRHIQLKSALPFIPLCFYCCRFINRQRFDKLMMGFVAILATALAWCLITAFITFIKYQFYEAPVSIFFYHQLVSILGQHAVQFSILVFAGLMYLWQTAGKKEYILNKWLHFALIIFFIGSILLLSSKLVILFLVGYLLFYLFIILKNKIGTRLTTAVVVIAGIFFSSLLLFTHNPVSRRFNDILHGDIRVVEQASFSPEDYFNGLQFRLLQWRFVKEIMQEHKAWLWGVSPGDAQTLLNQKYKTTHMYTGEPSNRPRGRGFLGYNTHNQWLESLLQTGIIGLLCFIFICIETIKMALRQNSRSLYAIVILLIAYTFNESVFETQYGLILFTFLPLFFYFGQVEEKII